MKCEDFGRFLDNYENLTDSEKAEMNSHAAMCEKCRQELDFFLSMLAVTRTLPNIDPPADFMDTLNARLDAEDRKPSPNKIIYHVRRNWKQYTSLAACLALVAVITANRGILLDRIEGNDEDGVITEETVKPGDSAAPNAADDTAAEETAAALAPAIAETAALPSAPAETPVPVRTSAPARTAAVKTAAALPVASSPKTETSQAPADNTTSAEEQAPAQNKGGDYGIALKGALAETASVAYDLKPNEVSASLRASKIIDGYSLADGTESIALGAYYSIDPDGKLIMTIADNAIKAVGSLKISSKDEEKAMEILSQYPHDESGNVYTTGSENVEEILSELTDEDVTYTNYIVGGSDDVKFRVEFN